MLWILYNVKTYSSEIYLLPDLTLSSKYWHLFCLGYLAGQRTECSSLQTCYRSWSPWPRRPPWEGLHYCSWWALSLFLSLSLSPSNSQLLQCTAANIIIIVILSQFFKWPYIFIILLSCRLFDQPVIVMASVFVLLPHHMACRWRQLVPRSRQLKGKKLESSLLILYIYRHISTMHADAIV